ncbi:alanine or glycine:cation symporter, AGCS family [Acetitomaculum ruminis DSM 5522]|uniref:Alanine or glycine:cation symporter, AGCS family n=1 Tax=Acetitomaculum ruminis DSM 5522 TaxID=1120918 RepID=A0A1I0WM91_9FIRM|nr:alanine/glycine:cation symporter family protein [Acetitomaculum ruminis]SFA89497.1 alanine or glycine:cation symporter, AGCS family [Acetitomaculum ruminis DSM 5522]
MKVLQAIYDFLWGDLITIPLLNGSSLGLSLLIIILIPLGIFSTIITRFLPVRLFPEMLKVAAHKGGNSNKRSSVSGIEALIVSTATRVGMGNLVGVVAAVSAGGAGAVFWMWITAIIGSSTAFIEATLAQVHKSKDPLYGGFRGGPAYYLHKLFAKNKNKSILAVLFSLSGLLCWCGISQVIGNSVSSAFENAFNVPPLITAIVLCLPGAYIVLKKNVTVKVLDFIVPLMAGFYILLTLFVIINNFSLIPSVFARIFNEAFGLRQAVSGGFGAILMNGVKRGLFSNEAGSGSAPCAAAAADVDHPAKSGLLQSLGVFIDTILICSCTAFVMLLVPENVLSGLSGMDLLQKAMSYHFGNAGVIFIAITLWFFSFSTFLGILFYARSNIAYVFGDSWTSQTIYKAIALINLFIGCLAAYTFVWDLGDVGIGLMTIFNVIALIPMSKEAVFYLKDYETKFIKHEEKAVENVSYEKTHR